MVAAVHGYHPRCLPLLALLAATAGCGEASATGRSARTPAAAPASPPPELRVSAEALAREYAADTRAADARYKGRWLAVTGYLEDVDLFPAGLACLRIRGLPGDAPPGLPARMLRCEFAAGCVSQLVRLDRGQQLTFKGRCQGDHGGLVDFVDCQVLDLGADPARRVTAAELTRAFVEEESAARQRYKDQVLLVEGTVIGQKEIRGMPWLLLGGHNEQSPVPVRVAVGYPDECKDDFARLKNGDRIQVRGECGGLFLGEVLLVSSKRVK
jgi:hypothetical protein